MSNKISDLNPKNEKYNQYQEKTKNLTSRAAKRLYTDKHFSEEYQPVFISATVLKLVSNIVSAITLLIAAYLAFNSLLGVYLSLFIGIVFCIVFEVLKAYIWRITSKQFLKYKRITITTIMILIGLHLVSFGGSVFGAWHLPTLLIQEQEQEVLIKNLDDVREKHLAEIATIDQQIRALEDNTSSSTIRRTIKSLTDQRKTTLEVQKATLEELKQQNKVRRQESKDKAIKAKIEHNQKVNQSQVSCLIGAIFFELLFIVCSIFISYYLFRQFIDEEEQSQESKQTSNSINLSNMVQDDDATGEQAPIQNRVIVEGFKQKKGKRLEANVQELKYTKICALGSCKKPFIHSIHNQKYCTVECRKTAYEKRKANKVLEN